MAEVLTHPQRLKAALWFSIGKIVDAETLRLGVNATPQFIGALTEMVWAQIGKLPLPPITGKGRIVLTTPPRKRVPGPRELCEARWSLDGHDG